MRLTLALLAGLIFAQEPAKVPLAWTLKKGEKVRYEITQKFEKGGGPGSPYTELLFGVALEGGDSESDGTIPVTFTIERIAESTQSLGGKREDYDSARDAEPPDGSAPRVFSKCVGKSFQARMKPTGDLEALDAIRKTVQAAVDAWPDLMDRKKWSPERNEALARRIQAFFQASFNVIMGGPAAVGDSWVRTFEDKELTKGLAKVVRTATFTELRDGIAIAEVEMKLEPAAFALKEVRCEGTLAWDTKRGLLKTMGLTARLKAAGVELIHRQTVELLENPAAR